MGTAIVHPVPDRVKPSFVIFDIIIIIIMKAKIIVTLYIKNVAGALYWAIWAL